MASRGQLDTHGLRGPGHQRRRLPPGRAQVNLAAYGGVVFPLTLLIEAPIIMLLAASTALSRDWPSYIKLRRFMNRLGFSLTVLHVIMVATPVYYFLARDVIQAPEEIIGPARIGLLITIPWTWSIAYRRFHQGVLIRFGHSLKVGLGTGVRLCADGDRPGGRPRVGLAGHRRRHLRSRSPASSPKPSTSTWRFSPPSSTS